MLVNPALAIPGALAGAFFGSKVTEMGPSGSFYAGLTDEQQDAVDEIYGSGGDHGRKEMAIIVSLCLAKVCWSN